MSRPILPSDRLKLELDQHPIGTIRYQNEKWFEKTYITNKLDPIEENHKSIPEIGKIYTFTYDPIYKDELNFYDNMPINLILGYILTKNGHMNPYGINLSFIPPKTRILVLSIIYKIFWTSHIKPNIERISEDNWNTKILPFQYDVAKKILNKSGFEFAIRSYRMDHFMSKLNIVTYEDWWRLGTLSSDFIRKMTSRQIYYLYNKNAISGFKIGQKTEIKITKTKIKDVKKYLNERYT